MTIRNLDHFIASLWDWGFIEKVLPGKLAVSDVDGVIERKGSFLLLEAKQPGASMPLGQKIMFSSFLKLPQFTVIELWGRKNKVESLRVSRKKKTVSMNPATNADLKKIVKWWYECANRKKFNWP